MGGTSRRESRQFVICKEIHALGPPGRRAFLQGKKEKAVVSILMLHEEVRFPGSPTEACSFCNTGSQCPAKGGTGERWFCSVEI